jgi:hypothetical protein
MTMTTMTTTKTMQRRDGGECEKTGMEGGGYSGWGWKGCFHQQHHHYRQCCLDEPEETAAVWREMRVGCCRCGW